MVAHLAMTGGQGALILGEERADLAFGAVARAVRPAGLLVVRRASETEVAAHARILQVIDKASGGRTAWRAVEAVA